MFLVCLQAMPDGSLNIPYYAKRAGQFYTGAMSGTQKDMHQKASLCYEYA
jgi:hypothetical protein